MRCLQRTDWPCLAPAFFRQSSNRRRKPAGPGSVSHAGRWSGRVTVKCPAASARHLIHETLTRCGVFTDEEIRVAIEMFDSGLAGDYAFLAIDAGGTLRAYACFGKASL